MSVDLPRPRSIRPGQFVYIWAPAVSAWSFAQSHPLSVAWWNRDDPSEEKEQTTKRNHDEIANSLTLLIQPMEGFSNHLFSSTENFIRVMVDGPYGVPVPTEQYGTIVLFASGIGIAAQLPFIKQALQDIEACRTSLRRVSLVWQVDNESE